MGYRVFATLTSHAALAWCLPRVVGLCLEAKWMEAGFYLFPLSVSLWHLSLTWVRAAGFEWKCGRENIIIPD